MEPKPLIETLKSWAKLFAFKAKRPGIFVKYSLKEFCCLIDC